MHIIRVTAEAPVNIAVIKYCEFTRDMDKMRGCGLQGSLLVKCGDFSAGLPHILLIQRRIRFSVFFLNFVLSLQMIS